eukprot:scaffold5.g871.t1
MAPRRRKLVQEPPESYMRQEGMDDEHLASFAHSADAVAVVGGKIEFRFHTAMLSQKSKFLAGMLDGMADGGVAQPSSKRRRGTAAQQEEGPLRIDAPFADVDPDAMRAFMRIAYGSATAADVVKEMAGKDSSDDDEEDFSALAQLAQLADQLAATATLAALDAAVASLLAPDAAPGTNRLMALLSLADGHREQLPSSYQAAVDAVVKAAATTCSRASGDAPMQRLLAHELFDVLSHQTLGIVLQGLISTVRSVARVDQLAGIVPKPARTQRGPFSGSFTWEWQPGFGVDDPRATHSQLSPAFDVGGVEWVVQGYLNGKGSSSRGHVSLYLGADTPGGALAGRKVKYNVILKSSKGKESDVRKKIPAGLVAKV